MHSMSFVLTCVYTCVCVLLSYALMYVAGIHIRARMCIHLDAPLHQCCKLLLPWFSVACTYEYTFMQIVSLKSPGFHMYMYM